MTSQPVHSAASTVWTSVPKRAPPGRPERSSATTSQRTALASSGAGPSEAITRTGRLDRARGQALRFQKLFGVMRQDIVPQSYSDLVEQNHRA